MARVMIIGDIHGQLCSADIRAINASDVDVVLFVGDLEPLPGMEGFQRIARGLRRGAVRRGREKALPEPRRVADVAAALSRVRKPSLLVLGNHDGTNLAQLAAAISRSEVLDVATSGGMEARVDELVATLEGGVGALRVGGYSLHTFAVGVQAGRFDVIVGRPHSMGGPALAFRSYLARRYGVGSIGASAATLIDLVEQSSAERLIFLSHNGPTGLGEGRDDIWGRDFDRREGDWGDPDLALAVERARTIGKRVIAVVAGHMHHALVGGGRRPWKVEREGCLFLNAARVPRLEVRGQEVRRHHLLLEWDDHGADAFEDFWS